MFRSTLAAVLLLSASVDGLSHPARVCRSRRIALGLASAVVLPLRSAAENGFVSLSEEEMAARVARKQELLRRSGSGSKFVSGLDVRSDVNPEAGQNLRSRSMVENAKETLAKQQELKNRNKAQKRDDLCEMLGRGC